ncbi:PDZ domain-containing protein [Rhodohalobacter sp. SW132]|uniref:M28 family peptidase n=1 Tax=Rhodohalobacter sp. SW132 TaxID=2293433 RepID=UPI000E2656E8|nr:M28 family peptidase [Rhodohalobacter sp. SW132]REL25033.1 PDZ domain-containing protein [Rhodohalobacter sp. SW132]
MNYISGQLSSLGIITLILFIIYGCSEPAPSGEHDVSIREHVEWLTSDELEGRLAGSAGEATAANYIADQFLQHGLIPAGDEGTYFQQFVLEGPIPQAMQMENHIARNVVAKIEGRGESDEVIVIGAHYDSQGRGGMISMETGDERVIHPGADDNASGTAGLLWLAGYFSDNTPDKDMIFVAFSGEEMGLLGSGFFVEQMEIEPENVLAMINFDMIGRMEGNELTIFGTGTAEQWNDILQDIDSDSLNITRTPAGTGASDHASFYEAGIPVLHYHTGTHTDYHRSSDTANKINYAGIEKVMNHASILIELLDQMNRDELTFHESTDPRESTFDFEGPTLGVTPDYSFSGTGFRVSAVREGEPAEQAGMQAGDVIVRMGGIEIEDIYDYMESLGEFRRGDELTIIVNRDGEEVELDVQF